MNKLPLGKQRWLVKHATGHCAVGTRMDLLRKHQDHRKCPRKISAKGKNHPPHAAVYRSKSTRTVEYCAPSTMQTGILDGNASHTHTPSLLLSNPNTDSLRVNTLLTSLVSSLNHQSSPFLVDAPSSATTVVFFLGK